MTDRGRREKNQRDSVPLIGISFSWKIREKKTSQRVQGKPKQGVGGKYRHPQGRRGKRATSLHLQRSHIIEGMIQLLADGFVLQLLGVQFVCSAGGGGQKSREAAARGTPGVATEQRTTKERERKI